MPGVFEIFQDKAGDYRFRLKASNGQVVLASDGYKDKSAAKKSIEEVRRLSADERSFELIKTSTGYSRFNLRANDGKVIGTSEAFHDPDLRNHGVALVMKNASKAKLDDLTVETVEEITRRRNDVLRRLVDR